MQPILTTASTNNNFTTNSVDTSETTLVDKIKQATLNIISDTIAELNNASHSASPLWMLPIQNFITLYCSDLDTSRTPTEQINIQNLSLNGSSSTMLQEAVKVSTCTLATSASGSSRLKDLEEALKCCRQQKQYKVEYLLRKLFIHLVRLEPTPSREELSLSIRFEQEHIEVIDSLSHVPEEKQQKYDSHLESYLELVSKLTGCDLDPEDKTLRDNYSTAITHLRYYIVNNPLNIQDKNLARNSLAFLYSRPEWLFLRDRLTAKELLITAKEDSNEADKTKIDFDLFLLQANQAIENQYSRPCYLDVFKNLLNRIQKILPLLSHSDKIIALYKGVQLYEILAKEEADPSNIKDKIINCLKSIITIATTNSEHIDYIASQTLVKSYFFYGFYLSFYFKNKDEYNDGLKALSTASQSFWTDSKTQQAAARLTNCLSSLKELPSSVKINKENFLLLQSFKLMLLEDICNLNLYQKSKGPSNNGQSINIKFPDKNTKELKEFLNSKELIWDKCQKEFSSFFFNNQLKETENLINSYYAYHFIRSQELLQNYNHTTPTRFLKLEPEEVLGKTQIALGIDSEKIINLLNNMKDNPLTGDFFAENESRFLDSFENLAVKLKDDKGNTSSSTLICSTIEHFNDIFRTVVRFLKSCQGNLGYIDLIQHIMRKYISEISGNGLIKKIANSSSNELPRAERNYIKWLRHDHKSIICYAFLAIDAYKYMDCHLPSNGYEPIFKLGFIGTAIGTLVENSNENNKLFFNSKYKEIAYKNFQNEMGSDNPKRERKALITFLHAIAVRLTLTKDPEERKRLGDMICSNLPDTLEGITKELEEFKEDETLLNNILQIALIKSMHLMSNQQVQEGISLYTGIMDRFYKPSNQKKMKKTPSGTKTKTLALKFDVVSDLINPAKIVKRSHEHKIELQDRSETTQLKQDPTLPRSENEPFSTSLSDQKQIKAQALQLLKKMELKKEKKEARVSSSNSTSSSTLMEVEAKDEVPTPKPIVQKYINKKTLRIFNLLWECNSTSQGPWETRSYRNDIKIKKQEVLKLIEALGGTYSPSRGHGSHHIAHLPKIELNGNDVGGLVDYETNEIMITLTNDEELKFYQIIQLRNILIGQGFTPDTVKEKSQNNE